MAKILLVGINPDEVDFSDSALPPGLDAGRIRAGIERSLEQLTVAGHLASQMYVSADPTSLAAFADRLAADPVDCVTIGGGVTRPPQNAELFEALLNVITRATPPPRIALVLGPENVPAAIERVMR